MSRWRSIQRLFYSPSSGRKFKRRTVKLQLEPLEIRIVPANTWTVDNTGDANVGDVSKHIGDLRFCVNNAASGDSIVFDPSLQGKTIALLTAA